MGMMLAVLALLPLCCAEDTAPAPDAAAIMAKLAANFEAATDTRRSYVYQETVRSSLVRANGNMSRKEKREYAVTPSEKGTDKKLTAFEGQYRKGKQMLPYTEPGYKYKDLDIDAELLNELTDELVNEKGSRDGIPASLFPLRTKDLNRYRFTLLGETEVQGRRVYRIRFDPVKPSGNCIAIPEGSSDDCEAPDWRGEAWVDAAEFQPVRIFNDLAVKVPWGVRVFLGTNLHQTGFSITYRRVEQNVWFPSTYGAEFKIAVLWGYKRTITLSLESGGFQKTEATSTVRYETPPAQ